MTETRTPDELRKEVIDKLGEDFGTLLCSLYFEILWLTNKWHIFHDLFCSKPSRIDLMNESSSFFFFTVQEVLRDDILLTIARLTDPPKSMGKMNMTLKSIGGFLRETEKPRHESDLEDILNDSMFCRDWRNRKIAHMDYKLFANLTAAGPLEPATKERLEQIVFKIQKLYNRVSNDYLNEETIFSFNVTGATSILRTIENGLRFKDEVDKQMREGTWEDNFQSKV